MIVPPWARSFSLHDAIDNLSVDVIKAKLGLQDVAYDLNTLDRTGRTPLQCAISRGFEPVVELLIEKGAKLDAKDIKGDTAVHYAVLGDDDKSLRILDMLVNKGVDINITGQLKQTPLHVAVKRDFQSFVRYLLGKGAKIDAQDLMGRTPLHYAILKQQESIVKDLLEYGSHVDLKDENGQTALHLAATGNFISGVSLLLNSGSNVNLKDSMGNTSLHYSVFPGRRKLGNHKSCVIMILNSNADIGHKNEEGQTPLHLAVAGNYFPEVKLLLEAGAEVDARDMIGRTPLHYANMRKRIKLKIVRNLLDSGADVNNRDDYDRTPLHCAAAGSFVSRGTFLVERGADVNAKDSNLDTPLLLCLSENSSELVTLLLQNQCEVDPKNINGRTPLQIAVEKNLTFISKLLIDKGAGVNIKDRNRESILHLAVSNLNVKIVEKLLQNGADLDCRDVNGRTPLHVAANFMFTQKNLPRGKSVINLLLLNGSDILAKDNNNPTPFEFALIRCGQCHCYDIVQLLLEWGGYDMDSCLLMDRILGESTSIFKSMFISLVGAFFSKLKNARMLSQSSYHADDVELYVVYVHDEYRYCEELKRMKIKKFDRHALSDVFFKYSDLTFLSNKNMQKCIFSSSSTLENEFPLYATILRATYLRARQRLNLLPAVSKSLMLPLPEEIMWKIFSYVDDNDLKNVVKASSISGEV